MPGHDVIFYDGVCGLCNRLVQFMLRHDPTGRFRFAALQSHFARDILVRYGRNPDDLGTVYVIADYDGPGERLLAKSSAILHLLGRIGGAWRLTGVLRLLPARLRDVGYDLVARSRYRVFGRLDTCILPRPEDRRRFIET